MKVGAYQAPLLPSGSLAAVELISQRVKSCESEGVEILCCPEAILGGLADYAEHPDRFALHVDSGNLDMALKPLASDSVTTIVGFTEITDDGTLFNSAAVYHRGTVLGIYRKCHPAIRSSVYTAGERYPVFSVSGLKFGIVICRDSIFSEPAKEMADSGATVIFVPTNNGLPKERACDELPNLSRKADIERAIENSAYVIRADVAGANNTLLSYGSSEIVGPTGVVLQSAAKLSEDLIVANIDTEYGTRN